MRSQVLDQVTQEMLCISVLGGFQDPSQPEEPDLNLTPVFEQEVGLETSRGPFPPQLSCGPNI